MGLRAAASMVTMMTVLYCSCAQPAAPPARSAAEPLGPAVAVQESRSVSAEPLGPAVAVQESRSVSAEPGQAPAADHPAPSPSDLPRTAPVLEPLSPGDAPCMGPSHATITVYELSDYQCPFCERGHRNVREAIEAVGGDVRLCFIHNPLDMDCNPSMRSRFHQHACRAARGAVCAQEQGRFWDMSDRLLEGARDLADNGPERIANVIGLDVGELRRCMESPLVEERIRRDLEQGRRAGVGGTPAYVINGRLASGAMAPAQFEAIFRYLMAQGGQWGVLD